MTRAACLIPVAVLAMAGCAEMDPVRQGTPDLVESSIEPLSGNRFAVTLVSLNTDGYELARCIAAGHVNRRRNDRGERVHDVFRRDGGSLKDEFRVVEGVRTQTTSGLQTYGFDKDLTVDDHDGRDVMAVDVQLARCDRAGLPTGAE